MWTLVLYTILFGATAGGGASSNMITLKFDTETQCKAAFDRLASTATLFDNANKPVGVYRVSGQCIPDAK